MLAPGIFIYHALKSARAVPVFVPERNLCRNTMGVVELSMAIDAWIAPSPSGADIMWTKVMKMTDRHALFYSRSRRASCI